MSKFKPGDRVIVAYRHYTFNESMDQYVGKSLQIQKHIGDSEYYELSEDGRVLVSDNGFPWVFSGDCLMKDGPYAKYHVIAREICGH